MTKESGCTRRNVLCAIGLLWMGNQAHAQATPLTPDQWLEIARQMPVSRSAEGILSFTRFKDPMYILNSPISWKPKNGSTPAVEVPAGFVTDLASVPEVFFGLFRPDGDYAHAAVIHDYLYWEQKTTRNVADTIFEEAMKYLGVSSLDRNALFQGVDKFGGISWAKNAELKKSGEKRILKKSHFPTDPKTTWAEWKIKPAVFASSN